MALQEVWKALPGFDGRYEVSNFGRVRSCANGRWGNKTDYKVLQQKMIPVGYK